MCPGTSPWETRGLVALWRLETCLRLADFVGSDS